MDESGVIRDASGMIAGFAGKNLSDAAINALADADLATQALKLYLDVNGHRYQDGSTETMVYDVAYVVSYLS